MRTTMKLLLAGVAALSITSAAHAADASLPKQMIGNWCYDKAQQSYVRGTCADDRALIVRATGSVTVNVRCKFNKIERVTRTTYWAQGHCVESEELDDPGRPVFQNGVEFELINNRLKMVEHGDSIPRKFTGTWCTPAGSTEPVQYRRRCKQEDDEVKITSKNVTFFSEETEECSLSELWGSQQNRVWGKFWCRINDGDSEEFRKIGVTITTYGTLSITNEAWED